MKINIPSHLSDDDLIAEARLLARTERQATAQLVAHIAELEARRIHLAAGFPSLFAYCREVLQLSEQSTYNRTQAAHAARSYPVILDMLCDASLTLAAVRLLAPHLTPENHQDLLKSAAHRSKREVEVLVARHFPQPDVADSVRKVRSSATCAGALPPEAAQSLVARPVAVDSGSLTSSSAVPADGSSSSTPAIPMSGPATNLGAADVAVPPVPSANVRRQAIRPLAEDRYEIRFTAPESTCEKLRLAQDMLRHAVPSGDIAVVIDRALTVLLDELARKKFAATTGARDGVGGPDLPAESGQHSAGCDGGSATRYIPAAVRRTVWLRDGGRCAFVSADGRRCGTRAFLEFHHVEPFAAGGPPTSENIQLRCRAHNSYEAQLYFDPAGLADATTCPGAG